MILIRLFLLVLALSFGLVVMLAAGLVLVIRHNLRGVFIKPPQAPREPYEGNTIEGEYQVIDEQKHDSH